MTKVLIFAAVAEAATGLALLIVPSLAGQLLLGEELAGIAIPVVRVAGIAVISLGTACWPGPPLPGMLTYSTVVALYLAYLGFAGGLVAVLLWPAVALHVILSFLLGRAWLAMASRSALHFHRRYVGSHSKALINRRHIRICRSM